jgi:hypothetical protein
MDVEISVSGHLIRKLVLCPIPELILRPLTLCFIEILINLTIISPLNTLVILPLRFACGRRKQVFYNSECSMLKKP